MLAGTAYAIALSAKGSISRDAQAGAIESGDELARRRSLVNSMALSSGVLAAGAIGVGVTAFISTDGGGLGLTARF